MNRADAGRPLVDVLAGGGAISAVEVGASRDGRRRELLILAPVGGAVHNLTRAVAVFTRRPRGRRGSLIAALGDALGQPVRYCALD